MRLLREHICFTNVSLSRAHGTHHSGNWSAGGRLLLLFNVSHTETWIRFWATKQSNICKLQAEAAAREAEASSREHLEDLLARMEARERWLAGERKALGGQDPGGHRSLHRRQGQALAGR